MQTILNRNVYIIIKCNRVENITITNGVGCILKIIVNRVAIKYEKTLWNFLTNLNLKTAFQNYKWGLATKRVAKTIKIKTKYIRTIVWFVWWIWYWKFTASNEKYSKKIVVRNNFRKGCQVFFIK